MTSLERKIQEWARTANLDGDLRPAIERAARELVALVREETLVEILSEIDAKFQKVPRAHTYASENADRYQGFDDGISHALMLVHSVGGKYVKASP